MTATLEDKLAQVVNYLIETQAKRISIDDYAIQSYLDDPEVAQWLDTMNKTGRIRNTRFTQ